MEKKPRYTLGKKERLKSRKAIEQIFAAGQGFSVFPFRVTWMVVKESGNGNQEADGRWQMADGGKTDHVNEAGNANQEMPFRQPPTVNRQQADGRWQMADGGKTDHVNEAGNANQEMPFRQPPTVNRQPFLQVAFSVSRRQFKRAVDRNRIKRLMREAWRLQKTPLQDSLLEKGLLLRVFLIFTGRELPQWALVQEKIVQVMKRLQKSVHEKPADHL